MQFSATYIPTDQGAAVIPDQVLPQPTTMTMPGMVTTAQITSQAAMGNATGLTPGDLIMPLPSIVDNRPTDVAQCNSFSQWIDANPLMAGGILLALAWFTLGRGRR